MTAHAFILAEVNESVPLIDEEFDAIILEFPLNHAWNESVGESDECDSYFCVSA